MLWALIKDSTVAKVIVLLTAAVLLWWFSWYGIAGLILLLFADIAIMFGFKPRHDGDFVYSKDIQRLFAIDGSQLRVGMDTADVSSIERINLFQKDQFAYVDFSLNTEMQVRYKFPLQQYQPFLQWLQQHLPQVEVDTSFTS
uniref:hypothetical protein n=1 Tax=Rheinheimera sp. TaxID=1869214 RepID=UPI00404821A5